MIVYERKLTQCETCFNPSCSCTGKRNDFLDGIKSVCSSHRDESYKPIVDEDFEERYSDWLRAQRVNRKVN